MALKFSMILEAIDRASAPAKKARASIGGLTSGVRAWGQQVRKVSRDIETGARSIDFYRLRAERLRRVALGTFFRAAGEQARRFGRSLADLPRRLKLVERAGEGAKSGLKWLGGKALSFAGGAAKWAAAGAGALTSFSIFDMFKTAGQFEQFQVMLEGTEGSAKKARQAMAWVQKFAQTTPYELDQVMEAFVALKAYGIDPMNGSLQSLGDGASGMSKDVMQAVEALADAITGEYERLKEFGIRASKAGDKVTFTYRKNGQDIEKTVKATGSEIEKTITGIFSDRFGGGMARQSKTLFGMMSNLKDVWNGFLLRIAKAGIFDKVKDQLAGFLDWIAKKAEDGTLDKWAKEISDNLSKAFDWATKLIRDTNWDQVGHDIKVIAEAIGTAAHFMAQLLDLTRQFVSLPGYVAAPLDLLSWLGGSAPKKTSGTGQKREGRPLSAARRDELWRNSNPGKGYIRQPKAAPSPGWNRLPASRTAPKAPFKVGGALDINVKVQGPGTAKVQRVSTLNSDVPIRTKTGKTMGEAA